MNLSRLITIAQNSELNTLAVKSNVPAIVEFVNLGLLELYGRFPIYTEEHLIELVEGVTIYDLPDDFMYMTGAFEAPTSQFAHNSNPLPINEEGNPYSINTINFKQVQIPLTTNGAYISIIYVPKPAVLTSDDLDAEILIPDQLIQPLLNFIAYKGHGAIRVNDQTEGDVYYRRFEQSCSAVERKGIAIASDDLGMDTRIYTRGFP